MPRPRPNKVFLHPDASHALTRDRHPKALMLTKARKLGLKVDASMTGAQIEHLLKTSGHGEDFVRSWSKVVLTENALSQIPAFLDRFKPFVKVTVTPMAMDRNKAWLVVEYRDGASCLKGRRKC